MFDKCPKCGAEKRDPPYGGGVWCPETDGRHCVERQLAAAEKRIAALEKVLRGLCETITTASDTALTPGLFDGVLKVFTCHYCHFRSASGIEFKNPEKHALDCAYRLLIVSVQQARAALDQKAKPKPPGYVAGPAPSAFPGW